MVCLVFDMLVMPVHLHTTWLRIYGTRYSRTLPSTYVA